MRLNKNKGQLLIIFLAVGFFVGIIMDIEYKILV